MTDTTQAEDPTRGGGDSLRSWALAITAVVAFSVAVIGTYIPDQDPLSPFDEWVFLDYVDKLTNFGIPQTGELVDEHSLEVSSCRGVFIWGPTGSPCGGPYVSAEYPMGGITSADVHPPTYFAATAAIASAIRGVGLSDDLLTSNRVVGALWLALGLVLVLWLARELGASLLAGVGAAGVIASLPLIRYNNSYITPDALNIAVGATALIAAVRISRGRWPWWAMPVVGAGAGLVKTQMGLVVGAAALVLLWSAAIDWRTERNPQRAKVLIGSAVSGVVVFALVQLSWILARHQFRLGPIAEQGVEIPLTWNLAVQETRAFILRLGLGATEDGFPIPTFAYFSTAILIAAVLGAVFYRSVRDEIWAIGAALMVLVLLGSPILLLAEVIAVGEVIPSPTRYGASLIAGLGAVTATAFPGRRRGLVLASIGALFVAIVVVDNLAR